MKPKRLFTIMIVLLLSCVFVFPAQADSGIQYELAQVRGATAAFHDLATTQAAGYQLLPFYNSCVSDPELGTMGYHYINASLVYDGIVDPLQPEAMVYVPNESGELKFASVEYMVPASTWDATHDEPPELFGQTFGYNDAFGMYTMHAWIWHPNPSGMFEYYNPNLSCN